MPRGSSFRRVVGHVPKCRPGKRSRSKNIRNSVAAAGASYREITHFGNAFFSSSTPSSVTFVPLRLSTVRFLSSLQSVQKDSSRWKARKRRKKRKKTGLNGVSAALADRDSTLRECPETPRSFCHCRGVLCGIGQSDRYGNRSVEYHRSEPCPSRISVQAQIDAHDRP